MAKKLDKICVMLEQLIRPSFGPNALNAMLCTDTGKVMVTSRGSAMMTSLNLDQPLGRMLVATAVAHAQKTGDNCKTFVLLCATVLRQLDNSQTDVTPQQFALSIPRLKSALLHHIMPVVQTQYAINCDIQNKQQTVQIIKCLIKTFFQGKLNVHVVEKYTDLILKSIYKDIGTQLCKALDHLIDRFNYIVIECPGKHQLLSELIEGVVIQRNFIYMSPSLTKKQCIKFVILCKSKAPNARMFVDKQCSLEASLDSSVRIVARFVNSLVLRGVDVLFLENQCSNSMLELCRQRQISVVQFVAEEDIDNLVYHSNISPVYEYTDINDSSSIAEASSVKDVIIAGRPCVLLKEPFRSQTENVKVSNGKSLLNEPRESSKKSHSYSEAQQSNPQATRQKTERPHTITTTGNFTPHEATGLSVATPSIMVEATQSKMVKATHSKMIEATQLIKVGDSGPDCKAMHFVVCAPSAGMCSETSAILLACLKMLRTWMQTCISCDVGSSHDVSNSNVVSMDCDVSNVSDVSSASSSDAGGYIRLNHDISNGCGVNNTRHVVTGCDIINSSNASNSPDLNTNRDVRNHACHVIGGGAFELAIYDGIHQYLNSNPRLNQTVQDSFVILQKALLEIPLLLLANSYAASSKSLTFVDLHKIINQKKENLPNFANPSVSERKPEPKEESEYEQTDNAIFERTNQPRGEESESVDCNFVKCFNGKIITGINGKSGTGCLPKETWVIQSLSSKVMLLMDVLDLLQQVMRIDKIVSVRSLPTEETNDYSDSD